MRWTEFEPVTLGEVQGQLSRVHMPVYGLYLVRAWEHSLSARPGAWTLDEDEGLVARYGQPPCYG